MVQGWGVYVTFSNYSMPPLSVLPKSASYPFLRAAQRDNSCRRQLGQGLNNVTTIPVIRKMPLSLQDSLAPFSGHLFFLTVSHLPCGIKCQGILCFNFLHGRGLSIPVKFCVCFLLTFFSLSLSFFHLFVSFDICCLLQSIGNPEFHSQWTETAD